mmetsp:Transcript_6670/g.11130  ORF Transcript_6670/g.11130 Transcript_6670/m.11130 type:complete len:81 (-) Transcript_6670:258-500(-)
MNRSVARMSRLSCWDHVAVVLSGLSVSTKEAWSMNCNVGMGGETSKLFTSQLFEPIHYLCVGPLMTRKSVSDICIPSRYD